MDLDVERYLRCITLAAQANPCVAGKELRFPQSHLQILSGQGQGFQEFQHMIKAIELGVPASLIPLEVIQSALARCSVRSRLQRELDSHFEQKRFMSGFLLISWLQQTHTQQQQHHRRIG
jgi:hypothetical protein